MIAPKKKKKEKLKFNALHNIKALKFNPVSKSQE
jgi:hypothetical protein